MRLPIYAFFLMCRMLFLGLLMLLHISFLSANTLQPSPKSPHDYDRTVVASWNKLFFSICRNTEGYRVPVAVRVLGYMNWAAYESVAPAMRDYQSIAEQHKKIVLPIADMQQEYHWAATANAAYYTTIKHFFPQMDVIRLKWVDSLYNVFKAQHQKDCAPDIWERSNQYGIAVAQVINLYAETDEGAATFRENKPVRYSQEMPVGEDKWRRTYPDFLYALTPYWGKVHPISVSIDTSDFIAPLPFDKTAGSAFYKQAEEVYLTAKNINDEQRWIAEYWSDDIQFFTFDTGSRFMSIALQILEQQNADLETSLLVCAKMGIGLFDGSIACWKEKYHYNLLRPVSYIRAYIDPTWVSNLRDKYKGGIKNVGITPAHPAYPSGHSVFGAVAAAVLSASFGNEISFWDRSHEDRKDFLGMSRSFESFDTMMLENAYSRIGLGVHYRMDCEEGLRIGKIVGNGVNAMAWKRTKN